MWRRLPPRAAFSRTAAPPRRTLASSGRGAAPKGSAPPPPTQPPPQPGVFFKDITSERASSEVTAGLAGKSYFWELGDVTKTKGKRPAQVLGAKAAPLMAALRGEDLGGASVALPRPVGEAAKATLLVFGFRDSATKHTDSWLEPWVRRFGEAAGADAYEVNLQESAIMRFRLLRLWTAATLRRAVPAERHERYVNVLVTPETSPMLQALGLDNRMVGYVRLVDSRGRLRFRGQGLAEEEELEQLAQVAQTLLGKKKKA